MKSAFPRVSVPNSYIVGPLVGQRPYLYEFISPFGRRLPSPEGMAAILATLTHLFRGTLRGNTTHTLDDIEPRPLDKLTRPFTPKLRNNSIGVKKLVFPRSSMEQGVSLNCSKTSIPRKSFNQRNCLHVNQSRTFCLWQA